MVDGCMCVCVSLGGVGVVLGWCSGVFMDDCGWLLGGCRLFLNFFTKFDALSGGATKYRLFWSLWTSPFAFNDLWCCRVHKITVNRRESSLFLLSCVYVGVCVCVSNADFSSDPKAIFLSPHQKVHFLTNSTHFLAKMSYKHPTTTRIHPSTHRTHPRSQQTPHTHKHTNNPPTTYRRKTSSRNPRTVVFKAFSAHFMRFFQYRVAASFLRIEFTLNGFSPVCVLFFR